MYFKYILCDPTVDLPMAMKTVPGGAMHTPRGDRPDVDVTNAW
jgi:hypothetical protein